MTCRRVCRELVELFRFGDLDLRSAPHLEHLAECRSCREEVGLNRALVQQLRRTLAARVEGAAPSADAWAGILARTQLPERGLGAWFRSRSSIVLARLRLATAVSGTALAVVLAVNTQVGIAQPDPGRFSVPSSAAGERFERQPLVSSPRSDFVSLLSEPVPYVPANEPRDPEAFMLGPHAQLVGRSIVQSSADDVVAEPEHEATSGITFTLPSRSAPTPADRPDDGASVRTLGADAWSPGPVSAEPS